MKTVIALFILAVVFAFLGFGYGMAICKVLYFIFFGSFIFCILFNTEIFRK